MTMSFLTTSVAMLLAVSAAAAGLIPTRLAAQSATAAEDTAIRPFRADIPEEALVELRRRIAATRWPDQETVDDQSQGIQLAKIKPLVEYWGTGYDWRKAEGGSQAQCPAAVHDQDRRRRHPLHSRPFASSERPAADHDAWLARIGV
jgi:hypothetical protein